MNKLISALQVSLLTLSILFVGSALYWGWALYPSAKIALRSIAYPDVQVTIQQPKEIPH